MVVIIDYLISCVIAWYGSQQCTILQLIYTIHTIDYDSHKKFKFSKKNILDSKKIYLLKLIYYNIK
jgi:hypothetical protein